MSTTPETSTPLPPSRSDDGRFAKGNPGGPGRPRGAVRGAASALDAVAADASSELIKVAVDLARAGNLEALRLVLGRVWPQRRGRPLEIDGPTVVGTISDMAAAASRVADLVMQGDLSPQEGKEVSAMLELQRRMIETWDHEKRLRALEEKRLTHGKTDGFWPDLKR